MKYPTVRPELPPVSDWAPYLEETYRSNRFTNFGALSLRLEALLADQWGTPGSACVLASSCTAALAAPLIANHITGKVILPAFTFPATLSAIRMAGATPVLIDVEPRDWRVSPTDLDRAFAKTGARAAIVICPFGLRSHFAEHARVAAARSALLIIDNAAGLGVTRNHLELAPHVFEAYSLHATKPFGIGEGGAVFAHQSCVNALRRALNFGLPMESPAEPPHWGINGKMSEFQAAVGLAVAAGFGRRLEARRAMAARYAGTLDAFPEVARGMKPEDSAWQFFPILLPDDSSAAAFGEETLRLGMEIRNYYRPSLSSFSDVDRLDECPISESLTRRMCCVPVYSNSTGPEADEMLAIVTSALRRSLQRA